MSNLKIAVVGGGSVKWGPRFINDFTLMPEMEGGEVVLLDLDKEAAGNIKKLGEKMKKERDHNLSIRITDQQEIAFKDADFVLISITTGGLRAIEDDLEIPRKYGIYQTLADTTGPAGWIRGLRNIPVFMKLAKNIERYSRNAVVINYSNPLAVLTKTLIDSSNLKTAGICHDLYETREALLKVLDVEVKDLGINFAGTNHFFWITDFEVQGKDGYKFLEEKIEKENSSFTELVQKAYRDHPRGRKANVAGDLYDHTGYLTYIKDIHVSEFLPHYLTRRELIDKFEIKMYPMDRRKERKQLFVNILDQYLSGEREFPENFSGQGAVKIIKAFIAEEKHVDVMNLPNRGQIPDLPRGAVVETWGVADGVDFKPLMATELPTQIRNLVLPHVINQNLIVEASLEGNIEKAFSALYNDPLCSHLDYADIKQMGNELIVANKEFLAQFEL